MVSDKTRSVAGQAVVEFIMAIIVIVLVVSATVEFLPVFLDNIGLLKEVREEAGIKAISAEMGVVASDRKEEFGFEIPGIIQGDRGISGYLSEKIHMPAANMALGNIVNIPPVSGMTETMRYSNRDGTSEFVSGLINQPDSYNAIHHVKSALEGAGWLAHEMQLNDAIVFYRGDPVAPFAVAAAHAKPANDGASICITIIARTAGAQ